METVGLVAEPMVRKPRKSFAVPEGTVVDWTKTNKELAAQFDVCILTILHYRKKHGIPSNRRGRPNRKI